MLNTLPSRASFDSKLISMVSKTSHGHINALSRFSLHFATSESYKDDGDFSRNVRGSYRRIRSQPSLDAVESVAVAMCCISMSILGQWEVRPSELFS
jgi:hypothetical protein